MTVALCEYGWPRKAHQAADVRYQPVLYTSQSGFVSMQGCFTAETNTIAPSRMLVVCRTRPQSQADGRFCGRRRLGIIKETSLSLQPTHGKEVPVEIDASSCQNCELQRPSLGTKKRDRCIIVLGGLLERLTLLPVHVRATTLVRQDESRVASNTTWLHVELTTPMPCSEAAGHGHESKTRVEANKRVRLARERRLADLLAEASAAVTDHGTSELTTWAES
jgi:hypothetical protein